MDTDVWPIGTEVTLKMGGPKMVVNDHVDFTIVTDDQFEKIVAYRCVYLDPSGVLQEIALHKDTLKRSEGNGS